MMEESCTRGEANASFVLVVRRSVRVDSGEFRPATTPWRTGGELGQYRVSDLSAARDSEVISLHHTKHGGL